MMEITLTRAQEQWLREFGPSSDGRFSFASEWERGQRFQEPRSFLVGETGKNVSQPSVSPGDVPCDAFRGIKEAGAEEVTSTMQPFRQEMDISARERLVEFVLRALYEVGAREVEQSDYRRFVSGRKRCA